MSAQLGYRVQRLVQTVLARFELQLVRWPKPTAGGSTGGSTGGSGSAGSRGNQPSDAFFPHGSRPHKPWVVPPDLRADTRPWARTLVEVYREPLSWPTCTAPEGGMLLQSLIRNIGPETVVETGTAVGASTIWLAAGSRRTAAGRCRPTTCSSRRRIRTGASTRCSTRPTRTSRSGCPTPGCASG